MTIIAEGLLKGESQTGSLLSLLRLQTRGFVSLDILRVRQMLEFLVEGLFYAGRMDFELVGQIRE